jgi:hypothetical protein
MTRIEILEVNGIEMIISEDKKTRTLKKDGVEKKFHYQGRVSIEQMEKLFGKIKHSKRW